MTPARPPELRRLAPGDVLEAGRNLPPDWEARVVARATGRSAGPAVVAERRRTFDEAWCREHFPDRHFMPAARSHASFYSQLTAMTDCGRDRVGVFAGWRGGAKTTIARDEFVLWRLAEHPEMTRYVVLTGATLPLGGEAMENIKHELTANPHLAKSYPDLCGRGTEWNVYRARTRRGQLLRASGMKGSIRGLLDHGRRPDLVLWDDPEDPESSASLAIRMQRLNLFEATAMNLGHATTHIVLNGNPLHPQAIMSWGLEQPLFTPRLRVPAVLSWSESAMWGEWESILADQRHDDPAAAAQAFLDANRDEMLAGTEVDWPALWPYERLMERRSVIGPAVFEAEFQAQPRTALDSPFTDIHFWHHGTDDDPALEPVDPEDLTVVIAIDPAVGRHADRGSFTAMSVVGLDRMGFYRGLDYRQGRWKQEIIERNAVDLARGRDEADGALQPWRPDAIAVETVGAFEFLANDIEKALAAAGLPVPVKHYPHPGGDKDARVLKLGPKVNNGIIRFGPRQGEVVQQFQWWGPKDVAKDGPDSWELAIKALDGVRARNAPRRRISLGVRPRPELGPARWGDRA